MKVSYYECLWFTTQNCDDFETKEFKTKKQALLFYNKHKNDPDKFHWWVSSRDDTGIVIDDIVY